MSRGLGKLQKQILDYLSKQDRASYVYDIAWHLYHKKYPELDESKQPPRAFFVNVQRAIHSLAKKGLVHTGYVCYERGRLLVAWLSNQEIPFYVSTRRNWRNLPNLILEILTKDEFKDGKFAKVYDLKKKLAERLHISFLDSLHTPVSRAIQKLLKQGKIEVQKAGKRKIKWIRKI